MITSVLSMITLVLSIHYVQKSGEGGKKGKEMFSRELSNYKESTVSSNFHFVSFWQYIKIV